MRFAQHRRQMAPRGCNCYICATLRQKLAARRQGRLFVSDKKDYNGCEIEIYEINNIANLLSYKAIEHKISISNSINQKITVRIKKKDMLNYTLRNFDYAVEFYRVTNTCKV